MNKLLVDSNFNLIKSCELKDYKALYNHCLDAIDYFYHNGVKDFYINFGDYGFDFIFANALINAKSNKKDLHIYGIVLHADKKECVYFEMKQAFDNKLKRLIEDDVEKDREIFTASQLKAFMKYVDKMNYISLIENKHNEIDGTKIAEFIKQEKIDTELTFCEFDIENEYSEYTKDLNKYVLYPDKVKDKNVYKLSPYNKEMFEPQKTPIFKESKLKEKNIEGQLSLFDLI